jgi:hypothetical protein
VVVRATVVVTVAVTVAVTTLVASTVAVGVCTGCRAGVGKVQPDTTIAKARDSPVRQRGRGNIFMNDPFFYLRLRCFSIMIKAHIHK